LQFLYNIRAEFLRTMGIILPLWDDIPKAAEAATGETKGYFDGLYNDIATGFGDVISKWVSGATTFKDLMQGIWDEIKNAFFRMVGEMVSDAILGQFKKLFSTIGAGATDIVGGLAKSAQGIASGLLSGLGSIGSIITGLTSIINMFKGPAKQTDVTYWLKLILEQVGHVPGKFDGLKASVDLTRDRVLDPLLQLVRNEVVPYLRNIEKNTALLKGITPSQHGFQGTVTGPRMFYVEPGIREHVSITPHGNLGGQQGAAGRGGAAPVNYNLTYAPQISAMDSQDVYRFMAGKGREALEKIIKENVRGITRIMSTETARY